MQEPNKTPNTVRLGDIVAAAFELGGAMTEDHATMATLAARHVERVLLRPGNARLAGALARLAREMAAGGL
jgi:hypothetical protein